MYPASTAMVPHQAQMADDELFSECPKFLNSVLYLLQRKRHPAAPPLTGSEFCGIVRQDDVGVATQLCLQAGVFVDSICSDTGHTALSMMCHRGFPHTAKILIAAKADIAYTSSKKPLCPLWTAIQALKNKAAQGTRHIDSYCRPRICLLITLISQ